MPTKTTLYGKALASKVVPDDEPEPRPGEEFLPSMIDIYLGRLPVEDVSSLAKFLEENPLFMTHVLTKCNINELVVPICFLMYNLSSLDLC